MVVQRELGALISPRTSRLTMKENFHDFCTKILPSMEERVETDVLRRLHDKNKNPLFRKEIINAYQRRKMDIKYKSIKVREELYKGEELEIQPTDIFDPVMLDTRNIDYQSIGYVYSMTHEEFRENFTTGVFGYKQFVPKVYIWTAVPGFLVTEDILKIVELMRKSTRTSEMLYATCTNRLHQQLQKSQNQKFLESQDGNFQDWTGDEIAWVKGKAAKSDLETIHRTGLPLCNINSELVSHWNRKLSFTKNINDLEAVYKDDAVYLGITVLMGESFRAELKHRMLKWVPHSKEIMLERYQATIPEKFNNPVLDLPDNPYSNFLPSLDLENKTGEQLFRHFRDKEEAIINKQKADAEMVERISGKGPRNEINVSQADIAAQLAEETEEALKDESHLDWDDPNMSVPERDRRNRDIEILNSMFTESFLFDAIINFLCWNMHVPEVRKRVFDDGARSKMFASLLDQTLAHPKRDFMFAKSPEIFMELMGEFDLGKYILDCSYFHLNIDENSFRAIYHPIFGRSPDGKVRKKQKPYEGFGFGLGDKEQDYVRVSTMRKDSYIDVREFAKVKRLEELNQSILGNPKQHQEYINSIPFDDDLPPPVDPWAANGGKRSKIDFYKQTLEHFDEDFFEQPKEYAPLNLSLEEAKGLLHRTPANLDELSIRNFNGFRSGALVWGEQGTGKSGTLMGVTCWALKNDWVVLKIPSTFKLTQSKLPKKYRRKVQAVTPEDLPKLSFER